jgi:LmbE family N-acetylglucosaminyl deacetylase
MKIFNNRKIKIHRHVLLATLAILSIVTAPRAQQSAQLPSEDRIALYQALLDLTNPWTVMCIAAHPDDEDGTSLIVMRRKFGAHTVSLFSTFGEGGQNAIGPELYEEMGAIRARETMAAAEIQGSEAHFLGLKDFGFSKTRDEAFKFWGHEEGLRRMVLEIRKLRPDVIITNHSTTSNDHGQHQATALMVVEAFDAAADPNKFPEQLKNGVTTWQVQRLFVRARGNQAPAADAQIVTIDPNERDPVRGTMFAEQALAALQKHATQGPWPKTFAEYATRFRAFSGQPGGTPGQLPMIRYSLVREAKGATPLTAKDSHSFLDGLRLPQEISDEIEVATLKPDWLMQSIETRQLTVGVLVTGYRRGLYGLSSVNEKDRHRLALMRSRLERAIQLFAGIGTTVNLASQTLVPGSTVSVTIKMNNAGEAPVEISNCRSFLTSGSDPDAPGRETKGEKISPGATRDEMVNLKIPSDTPLNVPVSTHLYEPSALGVSIDTRCSLLIENTSVDLEVVTQTDVAPLVEIVKVTPDPAPVITDKAAERSSRIQVPFEVTLINHQSAPFNGRLAALDDTFGNPINDMPVKLAPGEKRTVKFLMDGQVTHVKNNSIHFLVKDGRWSSPLANVPFFATNASVAPSLRVGYLRGFDFSLPNALNALGVESKELSVDEVKTSDLQKYTSIIVDNRVYESQPALIAVNQKLLDYANAGGTLIVFYHKSDEWNPNPQRNRPQLAPYKLVLGNERVTDENAPITFIEPDHPLLNVPNKLGQEDFANWIQERGLYYPKEWDPQFHALFQSNDPGEAPLKGGLLVADYGRGHYIYTSMVWYRELRGGVPGAYRMLANMISYGRAGEGKDKSKKAKVRTASEIRPV